MRGNLKTLALFIFVALTFLPVLGMAGNVQQFQYGAELMEKLGAEPANPTVVYKDMTGVKVGYVRYHNQNKSFVPQEMVWAYGLVVVPEGMKPYQVVFLEEMLNGKQKAWTFPDGWGTCTSCLAEVLEQGEDPNEVPPPAPPTKETAYETCAEMEEAGALGEDCTCVDVPGGLPERTCGVVTPAPSGKKVEIKQIYIPIPDPDTYENLKIYTDPETKVNHVGDKWYVNVDDIENPPIIRYRYDWYMKTRECDEYGQNCQRIYLGPVAGRVFQFDDQDLIFNHLPSTTYDEDGNPIRTWHSGISYSGSGNNFTYEIMSAELEEPHIGGLTDYLDLYDSAANTKIIVNAHDNGAYREVRSGASSFANRHDETACLVPYGGIRHKWYLSHTPNKQPDWVKLTEEEKEKEEKDWWTGISIFNPSIADRQVNRPVKIFYNGVYSMTLEPGKGHVGNINDFIPRPYRNNGNAIITAFYENGEKAEVAVFSIFGTTNDGAYRNSPKLAAFVPTELNSDDVNFPPMEESDRTCCIGIYSEYGATVKYYNAKGEFLEETILPGKTFAFPTTNPRIKVVEGEITSFVLYFDKEGGLRASS